MALGAGTGAQTDAGKPETAIGPPRELAIALSSKPVHLNSAIASGMYTGIPAAQIFGFLLRLDHEWQYRPYLAEKWEISPDGLSATFHLRAGATFHDGRPVTSTDSEIVLEKFSDFYLPGRPGNWGLPSSASPS